MKNLIKLALIVSSTLFIAGCGSMAQNSLSLQPGMSKQSVINALGTPETRSFRGNNEAWQYSEIVGYGQCGYTTAWFKGNTLISLTTRKGSSVAGCGLGSREVDWGQAPKPSLDLNINYNK